MNKLSEFRHIFQDEVILVTGAGSGIGRQTALSFAAAGGNVILGDVNENALDQTADDIKRAGGNAIAMSVDVIRAEQVGQFVQRAVSHFGRLDYAINCAGISGGTFPIQDYPQDVWDQVLSVNLTGSWLCLKYEIEQMLSQESGGTIVNVASMVGLIGFPGATAYAAAKHGVIGMTKAAALEVADKGIRINAVCPGAVETPFLTADYDDSFLEMVAAMHPMKRLAQPQEVADTILWMCSDSASFLTGAAIALDGGYTAQ